MCLLRMDRLNVTVHRTLKATCVKHRKITVKKARCVAMVNVALYLAGIFAHVMKGTRVLGVN